MIQMIMIGSQLDFLKGNIVLLRFVTKVVLLVSCTAFKPEVQKFDQPISNFKLLFLPLRAKTKFYTHSG